MNILCLLFSTTFCVPYFWFSNPQLQQPKFLVHFPYVRPKQSVFASLIHDYLCKSSVSNSHISGPNSLPDSSDARLLLLS
ncbi:hypothetical protein Y032_0059g2973 [Ancylostoma ceylanicum]|uniref:Uncharacterized protein n=1 Tax=Ancylostoma ceylanicum TaxID=53326 RepID=A0A016U4W0_9BILA|nr:hypothetical protein Y032_0059g2973 [Ancylostoma ceylanicum]